jgi:hypothetical protein
MAKHGAKGDTRTDSNDPNVPQKISGIPPEVLKEVVKEHGKWTSIRTGVIGFFVCCSLLALYPVVSQLAGKETAVDVNIAISLSITFAITTGGATLWGRQQAKKADDARKRVTKLEGENLLLSAENRSLTQRVDGLTSDLERLRAEQGSRHRSQKREQ